MKILLVCYEWPGVTDCGGAGRMAAQLRERLQDRGHEVPVVTDESDGHYLTFPMRTYRRVARTIKQRDPDVLFGVATVPSSLGLGRLSRRFDVPLVVKTMGSDIHNPNQFQRVRPLLDHVNEHILSAADAVITQSRAMASYIEGHDPIIIPNCIDPGEWRYRPHTRHHPLRVLTVARLEPVKRIDRGVEAVDQLQDYDIRTRYRVVGDGSEGENLRQEFGDRCDVEFSGWADDVQPHYDWADVFMLPSDHESFGIVLLEALACGLPVVTTDTGGQVDILRPKPAVGEVTDASPHRLARGIARVADAYESYQTATRGYVNEHWHIDELADRHVRVFRQAARTIPESADKTPKSSVQPQPATQPDRAAQAARPDTVDN